jgi:hypothetical protein
MGGSSTAQPRSLSYTACGTPTTNRVARAVVAELWCGGQIVHAGGPDREATSRGAGRAAWSCAGPRPGGVEAEKRPAASTATATFSSLPLALERTLGGRGWSGPRDGLSPPGLGDPSKGFRIDRSASRVPVCAHSGRDLPPAGSEGRPRRFCSPACRAPGDRRRGEALPESFASQTAQGRQALRRMARVHRLDRQPDSWPSPDYTSDGWIRPRIPRPLAHPSTGPASLSHGRAANAP